MAPDPRLADSVGNWLVFGAGIAIAIWRRRKQNEAFAVDVDARVDASLAKQVKSIESQVSRLAASLSVTQDLVSIHSARLKEENQSTSALTAKIIELDETVKNGMILVQQFNDYLERAKAGTLIEKPIPGSGGLVAIKKEET